MQGQNRHPYWRQNRRQSRQRHWRQNRCRRKILRSETEGRTPGAPVKSKSEAEKGVRFIAINNNIDSANQTDSDFTPFLNIMNEWYARDASRKINAVFANRTESGLRCSGAIPYGYYRKPDDKQTLYVDEESAKVVRRIFDMVVKGYSYAEIAKIFSEEKVLCPTEYNRLHYPEDCRHKPMDDPYR